MPENHGAPIVLVEDNEHDTFFVRRALDKAGIVNPIIRFRTAAEARVYFDEARRAPTPALFIMDIHLVGGETGIDLLRWVRQQSRPLGSTPAMMLTGSQHPDDRDEAEMLGATSFLQKPVSEETLTAAVQSLGFVIVSLTGYTTQRTIARR
jgi:CheY-like chemotaxis protein